MGMSFKRRSGSQLEAAPRKACIAEGPATYAEVEWVDRPESEAFAGQAGRPLHHLVVRPESRDGSGMHKGISDWAELKAAFPG